jgi:hypothetical protein
VEMILSNLFNFSFFLLSCSSFCTSSIFVHYLSFFSSLILYRVYQNSTAKLQEWIPHVERQRKVYDNMGPEMYDYSYPSVYLLSARRHVLIAGINCETLGTIVTQVIKFRINLMWAWIPLRPAHTISCRLHLSSRIR